MYEFFNKLPSYTKCMNFIHPFQIKLRKFLIDGTFCSLDDFLNNDSVTFLSLLLFLRYLIYLVFM